MGQTCSAGQNMELRKGLTLAPMENPKTIWVDQNEGPYDNLFKTRKPITVEKTVVINKQRFAIPKGTINVRLPDDESECFITGAAVLPNGDIFLVDKNNKKLKLFAYKFHYKATMALWFTPESVCSVPKHFHVFVTFPELCQVWQIGIGNGIPIMKTLKSIDTQGQCTAICSNRFGGLALLVKSNIGYWQVHLINDHGGILKYIHIRQGEQHCIGALFIRPEHIAVTWDLKILVSDRGNNIVYHLTPEGRIIFVYKGIRAPLDVFTDRKDNIFLTGADSVHQIDATGRKMKNLLSQDIIGFAPMCMAYRATGIDEILVAAGKCDKVKVFVLVDKVIDICTKKEDTWEKYY